MPANLQSQIQPCVLIVARRSMRKNKFIDFVGEYHLDLIVGYGAVPLIVPRVSGIHKLLKSLEPIIHGVLLCEGEDIHPSLYENETQAAPTLSPQQLEEIKKLHCSDTSIDREKDSVEFELVKLCLEREIPYFGICRGSQMLNVVSGGTLYQDIGTQLSKTCPQTHSHVVHMDYGNYDGHRHPVNLVENTPLHHWFKDSLDNESMEILVNSYHHQGVEKLASRFVPMAFAPDGLVEGFYDPNAYNPQEGKFLVGLQFHPERMRKIDTDDFDYPGCSHVYQEFVKAVIAYQKKVNSSTYVPKPVKLDQTWKKRMSLDTTKELGIEAEAAYLESEVDLSFEQETRLMQMGATVRNSYSARIKLNEERKMVARNTMSKMSTRQLSNLVAFYGMMGQICSKVLDTKLYENAGK